MDQQTSGRSWAEVASGGAGTSGPGAKILQTDIVVMNTFLKLSTIFLLAILFMSYRHHDRTCEHVFGQVGEGHDIGGANAFATQISPKKPL